MKRSLIGLLAVMLLVAFAGCAGEKSEKAEAGTEAANMVSEQITLAEVTPVAELNNEPAAWLEKTVLIEGRVTKRCGGSGCWIEVAQGDGEEAASILVAAPDKSVIFPEDCVGKDVRVQGTLMVQPTDAEEEHDHAEGEADHECPTPQYIFAPEGMQVVTVEETVTES